MGYLDRADEGSGKQGDLVIDMCVIHHGKKSKNPIDSVRFFKKGEQGMGGKRLPPHVCRMSLALPLEFQKKVVRVFCRSEDPHKLWLARRAFDAGIVQPANAEGYEFDDSGASEQRNDDSDDRTGTGDSIGAISYSQ